MGKEKGLDLGGVGEGVSVRFSKSYYKSGKKKKKIKGSVLEWPHQCLWIHCCAKTLELEVTDPSWCGLGKKAYAQEDSVLCHRC